jgi:poly-gamma-glutamate synthesis protein (capsule biosynthesis protein)
MPKDLVLVGDVNLKRDLALGSHALDLVRDALGAADVRLGNLEGAFFDPSVELPYKPGWFHCEADQASVLAGAFDAVSCANNVHAGGDAIASSLARLDALGIAHTGAGATRADARAPAIVRAGDLTVGVLSQTWVYWPTGHVASDTEPGVVALKAHTAYEPGARLVEMPGTPPIVHTWPDAQELAAACEDIRDLAERVDHVVVYNHWGISIEPAVCEYQRLAARAFIDAGASIVAGSHTHTLQGVELYRGRPILYGLGNFIFGWMLHRPATRDGLLARVRIDGDDVVRVALQPVSRTEDDQARLLDPREGLGRELATLFERLCEPLGTAVTVEGSELAVTPAETGRAERAA